MRLYAQPATSLLWRATLFALCVSAFLGQPGAAAAFGGVLLGLLLARSLSLRELATARREGLELAWRSPAVISASRGATLHLEVELRNGGKTAIDLCHLRLLAAPELLPLDAPRRLLIPPASKAVFTFAVRPMRVGRAGILGVATEATGATKSFVVPLHFTSPILIDVMPAPSFAKTLRTTSSRHAMSRVQGRGDVEFRQLRAFAPGDSPRRVAWKASARQGTLMVREYDEPVGQRVTLVIALDMSLWGGAPGLAPVDRLVDEVCAHARALAGAGTTFSAILVSSTRTTAVPEGTGPLHLTHLARALLDSVERYDQGRTEVSDEELGARVREHLGFLGLDGLAEDNAMREALTRAPGKPMLVQSESAGGRRARALLSAYGLPLPPAQDDLARAIPAAREAMERALMNPAGTVRWFSSPELFDGCQGALLSGASLRMPHRRGHHFGVMLFGSALAFAPASERGELARWALRLESTHRKTQILARARASRLITHVSYLDGAA